MRKIRKVSFSRRFISKAVVTFAMSVIVCAASFATALANTVSTIVTDGEKSYTFSMESTDLDEIIKKAEEMGLAPLGPHDIYERVGNTTAVNVRRGVNITVDEAGDISEFIAFKGDTVKKALEDNSFIVRAKDRVTPSENTVLSADTKITIERNCSVTVFADGEEHQVSLMSATVQDALKKAGVELGKEDTVNYQLDKPLFDNMRIRVGRVVNIKITADGKTKDYKLSADSVENAIEKAGLKLGKDDIVKPLRNQRIKEGMDIVIQRVERKKETQKQEIAFDTVEEIDDSLYPEEGFVKTEGVQGEKEVTVEQYVIDGKLDREEVLEEKTVKEPIDKVVVVGTKKYKKKAAEPAAPQKSTEDSSSTSEGTIAGRKYTKVVTGSATAYSDYGTTASGDTTRQGLVAVNPNVIPYGTEVYVETSGGYSGFYIASDTGGALMSGSAVVDIWMPTSEECFQFGRQSATVYVLE